MGSGGALQQEGEGMRILRDEPRVPSATGDLLAGFAIFSPPLPSRVWGVFTAWIGLVASDGKSHSRS